MKKITTMKFIQIFLGIAAIVSFAVFMITQLALPAENKLGVQLKQVYGGTWQRVMEDGSREDITVPGQLPAEHGEWVVAETTLPQDLGDTWFAFRSMQQDMKIYIDGKLRQEYSTLATQPFGKTSTMAYVWLQLDEDDAGKVMRVEFMSDSFYSGYMEEILSGEKADILRYLVGQYGISTLMAFFLLLVGLTAMVACQPFAAIFRIKKNEEIFMMGMLLVMAATWLMVESKIRQFILPNSTIAMYMGFFMIMLLPYPFLSYINEVQKKRYEKVYIPILFWAAVNFVLCVTLQVLEIKDFFETMTSSHIVLGACLLSVFVTMLLDVKNKRIAEYQVVLIGFCGFLIAAIMEILLTYMVSAKWNGVPLCLALFLLGCTAAIKVGKEVSQIEREKQVAVAARRSQALFLANMSHEIRTPVNTVLGMNEMILRESENKTIRGYAKHIKRAGHMLVGLIDEVLDFSKIEAGKLKIITADYSLSAMITDVQTGIQSKASEKGLEFVCRIQEGLPAVFEGDELRIKQILSNLLSNAVKYTKKGSVCLDVSGNLLSDDIMELCFIVEDTGIGIKKEDIRHLFDSFQRLELEKNRHIQGTGLGLCITRQLVDAMNGTINVASEYGVGSKFEVRILQNIVSMEEPQREDAFAEENVVGEFLAPDAKILAVDDNRVNLAVLKGLLKRTQVQIDLAMSGMQALELTRTKKYDLILMDHMMPEMDGIETLAHLRAEQGNPNRDTRMIALTANAIQGAEQEYRREGFDDYLSKPVDPEKLERMLYKYLK